MKLGGEIMHSFFVFLFHKPSQSTEPAFLEFKKFIWILFIIMVYTHQPIYMYFKHEELNCAKILVLLCSTSISYKKEWRQHT